MLYFDFDTILRDILRQRLLNYWHIEQHVNECDASIDQT